MSERWSAGITELVSCWNQRVDFVLGTDIVGSAVDWIRSLERREGSVD